MEGYVLGIDNGGSGVKAVLFDLAGREVSGAKRSIEMQTPAPGHTERDMEQLWRMNVEAIREAIAPIDAARILGVSFSGHGKGLYLWGRDGAPVRPGIVSTDSRAAGIVRDWYADGTAQSVFPLTCQSVLASQPVALLKWLLLHEPGAIDRTRYVFGVKDYVRYRMTGEARAEITDISGSNLVNLATASYDGELLARFGLERVADLLPPLTYSAEFCGQVTPKCAAQTGLLSGTPVAAGLFDIDACAIAMDITGGDRLAAIAGTWSINEYISAAPVMSGGVKMNSLYCLPGWYLVEECSPTSASNHDWFVRQILRGALPAGADAYAAANDLAAAIAPEDCPVIFLPYLYGGSDDAAATAAFAGLQSHHTAAHMLRAVYEGVAFGHRLHIRRLLDSRSQPPAAVRLAGGVVRSPMWVQMFADILELPVETVAADELGALGAAMTAAVAAGAYADLAQAAGAMTRVEKVYRPNAALAPIYRQKFDRFMKVRRALGEIQ